MSSGSMLSPSLRSVTSAMVSADLFHQLLLQARELVLHRDVAVRKARDFVPQLHVGLPEALEELVAEGVVRLELLLRELADLLHQLLLQARELVLQRDVAARKAGDLVVAELVDAELVVCRTAYGI